MASRSSNTLLFMKNVAAITGSMALMLATSLIQPPSAEAGFKGTNEKTWYRSIQADIKNGASARTICINASSPAEVSDEVAFKNWAYGIARKYCSKGYEKSASAPDLAVVSDKCSVTPSDLYSLEKNRLLEIRGPSCYLFIKQP